MPHEASIRIELGDWPSMQADAYAVRYEVFVREQGVPEEIERDDQDSVSIHALAYGQDGQAVGTGRLLPDGHIGRMAVLQRMRGQGIGAQLLRALVLRGGEQGHRILVLHAQTHARAFYEAHGFAAYGPEFSEAGIAHIAMRRTP
jgi:predicted GNAT family N-acyltransferase